MSEYSLIHDSSELRKLRYTLGSLLHFCHYAQQCWILVADWEVKGSVESLQGVLDEGILDLPITEINVEDDCMKIWLRGLEEDGKR